MVTNVEHRTGERFAGRVLLLSRRGRLATNGEDGGVAERLESYRASKELL